MNLLRRVIAPAALLCVVALVAAGCGGSSNKSLSYTALVSQANAICRTVTTQVKTDAAAKKYDQIMVDSKAAQKKLAALKAPDELKDKYQTYLDDQQKAIDATQVLVDALKKNDQAAISKAQAAGQPVSDATDAAAAAAGLADCAK
jgi:hypothetical protein